MRLIAAALGVSDEVSRDAFSRVRPAPAGEEPDRRRVRANKAALLAALARQGSAPSPSTTATTPRRGEL